MSESLSLNDLLLVARMYGLADGLNPSDLSEERLIELVEAATGYVAEEVCRAVLYGTNNDVPLPKDLPKEAVKKNAVVALVRAFPGVLDHYSLAEVAVKVERLGVKV